MRISVDECDSGYRRLLEWGGPSAFIKVTLDGEEVCNCFTADEELGEVLIAAQDASGNFVIDGDEVKREWRRGVVKIDMPEMLPG